jgi:hypothetical protein
MEKGNQLHFNLYQVSRAGYAAVELNISHRDLVNVEMFNVTGRKICTIVKRIHIVGTYRYLWDIRNLPQGCYVVKMRAGAKQYIKTIQITR